MRQNSQSVKWILEASKQASILHQEYGVGAGVLLGLSHIS